MRQTLVSPRHNARAVAAIAAVLLGFTTVHALAANTAAPSAEEAVRAAETARGQALMKADTAALSRLIAPEFVEISRFAQLRSKADNMADIASGQLKLTSVKYDSVTVRLFGNVAVLQGIADNTGSFGGFPFAGRVRYTRVFVRRDGRWQAVAMQHTMMP